jgi:hypothetical protein
MRRLAVHVIEHDDPEAAQVLGDAMHERGLTRLETGRSRMIPHRFMLVRTGATFRQALSRQDPNPNVFDERVYPALSREVLLGIPRYASDPTWDNWELVHNDLVSSPQELFRTLRRNQAFTPRNAVTRLHWQRFMFNEFPGRGSGYLVSAILRTGRRGQAIKKPRFVPYFVVEQIDPASHLETAYGAKQIVLAPRFQVLGHRDARRRRS